MHITFFSSRHGLQGIIPIAGWMSTFPTWDLNVRWEVLNTQLIPKLLTHTFCFPGVSSKPSRPISCKIAWFSWILYCLYSSQSLPGSSSPGCSAMLFETWMLASFNPWESWRPGASLTYINQLMHKCGYVQVTVKPFSSRWDDVVQHFLYLLVPAPWLLASVAFWAYSYLDCCTRWPHSGWGTRGKWQEAEESLEKKGK